MPKIPAGAARPEDHQPSKEERARLEAEAAAAEANDKPIAVEYDGVTYTLVSSLADLELMDDIANMADGRWSLVGRILRKLIGPVAYEQFKVKYRDEKTGVVSNAPAIALFNTIDAALGE